MFDYRERSLEELLLCAGGGKPVSQHMFGQPDYQQIQIQADHRPKVMWTVEQRTVRPP